jgi:hypothetical protein
LLIKVFQSAVKCPATDVVAAGMLITGVKPPLDKTGPAAPTEVQRRQTNLYYALLNQEHNQQNLPKYRCS